jgi:hypothetical protein
LRSRALFSFRSYNRRKYPNILLKVTADGGATFGRMVNISSNANQETFPKVAAYEDSVYIAWNMAGDNLDERDNEGLFFCKELRWRKYF